MQLPQRGQQAQSYRGREGRRARERGVREIAHRETLHGEEAPRLVFAVHVAHFRRAARKLRVVAHEISVNRVLPEQQPPALGRCVVLLALRRHVRGDFDNPAAARLARAVRREHRAKRALPERVVELPRPHGGRYLALHPPRRTKK